MSRFFLIASAFVVAPPAALPAQHFALRHPVDYHTALDDNAATALNRRLVAGELTLDPAGPSGRLRALLAALGIPESSQVLVFSKTSLQRHRISPRSPRALYFGRDAYVGWVPGAAALEVAVSDPMLGLVFYTVPQRPDVEPRLRRDDSCLSCHASSRTDDEPGLLLRSVFPDAQGDPIASAGETRVTYRAPLAERWGGWLVTGRFTGEHRGNGIAARGERGRYTVVPHSAVDLAALAGTAGFAFDPADYPVPTSDIAALLALEQQVTVHNLLIRALLQMRCLLENDRALDAALGEDGMRDPTADIADDLAHAITAALLFADEVGLQGRDAAADPTFARAFPALWPADPSGLRLGRFDLTARTFVLPLSPMVHSRAFAALPDPLRRLALKRLRRALVRNWLPGRVALPPEQRQALHDHLTATLPGYGS